MARTTIISRTVRQPPSAQTVIITIFILILVYIFVWGTSGSTENTRTIDEDPLYDDNLETGVPPDSAVTTGASPNSSQSADPEQRLVEETEILTGKGPTVEEMRQRTREKNTKPPARVQEGRADGIEKSRVGFRDDPDSGVVSSTDFPNDPTGSQMLHRNDQLGHVEEPKIKGFTHPSNSPLPRLKGSIPDKVWEKMAYLERVINYNPLTKQPPLTPEELAAWGKDTWFENLGEIPELIVEIIDILARRVHYPGLFQYLRWFEKQHANERKPRYLKRGICENMGQMQTIDWRVFKEKGHDAPEVLLEGRKLLLTCFAQYYRLVPLQQRWEVSDEMYKSPMLGFLGGTILEWLAHIGYTSLASRMFSSSGADLNDLTTRIIIRRNDTVEEAYSLDFTLFTPPLPEQKEGGSETEEATALTRRWHEWGDSLSDIGSARFSLDLALSIAREWIERNDDARQETRGDFDPLRARTMIFRPGWRVRDIDKSKWKVDQSNVTEEMDRTPMIVDVLETQFPALAKDSTKSINAFNYVFNRIAPSRVVLTNRRQFSWHTASLKTSGSHRNDILDRVSVNMVFMLISLGIGLKYDRQDENFATRGDTAHRYISRLDFGGMFPLVKSPTASHPRFINRTTFLELRSITLRYFPRKDPVDHPSTARVIVDESWGLFSRLWVRVSETSPTGSPRLPLEMTVIVKDEGERLTLVADLAKEILRNIPVWEQEYEGKDDRVELVKARIALVLRIVNKQVLTWKLSDSKRTQLRIEGTPVQLKLPPATLPELYRG
ncbi:hypothetical protein P7C73_g291, partial [Tremellales sp. Uapishka_1]